MIFYCDICGQRYDSSEATKLSTYTGHGGAIVCRHDVDREDPGLRPYRIPIEKSVPWVRPGDTDTTDGTPTVDTESMTYIYYLASSQDGAIITSSQDGAYIITGEPV